MPETGGELKAGGRSRGSWGSELGFVLAAVGSAVGLGNMWRFSATASGGGGAAFVLLYIALTFVVGIPLLMAELSLGRRTKRNVVGALRSAAGRRWVPLSFLFILAGFVIFSFYSVIAGWALRYGVEAILVGLPGDPAGHFGGVATGETASAYHLAFVALTVAVVAGGVHRGIERVALALMPALFLILVGLALWAVTLPGAGDGYAYYLAPRFDELLDPRIIGSAAGQAYFSLSLGMGAILTFASYMDRDHDLGKEGAIIAASDFSVAFVAGLVVFPVVFALGVSDRVIGLTADEAEGVLFIALPAAFAGMGVLGRLIAIAFFAGLTMAALTSTVSLLEVVVSPLIDELGLTRRTATVVVGVAVALVGLVPANSLAALATMNRVAGDIFLGLGAFLTVVVVGWFVDDPLAELRKGASPLVRRTLPAWLFLMRYVLPVVTGAVLYFMLTG